jgi:hypothetical protein
MLLARRDMLRTWRDSAGPVICCQRRFGYSGVRPWVEGSMSKWGKFLSTPVFWFGVVAFAYGIVAITRCALYGVNLARDSSPELKHEALIHLLIWTFGPPLWFAIETSFFASDRTDLSLGQKLASGIWAAVFAAILVLVKP